MDDTISRQMAIALLENLFKNTIVEFGYNSYEEANDRIKLLCDGVSDAMEVIETMDSAQPEQKKGMWIYHESVDVFECSVCGRQMVRNIFDYCPSCRAKMEVER